MTQPWLCFLTAACAAGSGLIGGAFFAFSTFVMRALARLPAAQGIAAMQSINVVVLNPWFLSFFMGTAAGCVGVALATFIKGNPRESAYLLAGAACYLGGTFLVTVLCNVPWNDRLAGVDATSAEGAKLWKRYVSTWTAWNHVRTIAAVVASVLFMKAL